MILRLLLIGIEVLIDSASISLSGIKAFEPTITSIILICLVAVHVILDILIFIIIIVRSAKTVTKKATNILMLIFSTLVAIVFKIIFLVAITIIYMYNSEEIVKPIILAIIALLANVGIFNYLLGQDNNINGEEDE